MTHIRSLGDQMRALKAEYEAARAPHPEYVDYQTWLETEVLQARRDVNDIKSLYNIRDDRYGHYPTNPTSD